MHGFVCDLFILHVPLQTSWLCLASCPSFWLQDYAQASGIKNSSSWSLHLQSTGGPLAGQRTSQGCHSDADMQGCSGKNSPRWAQLGVTADLRLRVTSCVAGQGTLTPILLKLSGCSPTLTLSVLLPVPSHPALCAQGLAGRDLKLKCSPQAQGAHTHSHLVTRATYCLHLKRLRSIESK